MTPKEERFFTQIVNRLPERVKVAQNLWVGRFPGWMTGVDDPTIKSVYCVCEEEPDYPVANGQQVFHRPFRDTARLPPPEVLMTLARKVSQSRKSGGVLVHCWLGMNRSCLITCLALVLDGMQPQDALALVRKKRSKYALPNKVFRDWLLGLSVK